MFPYSSTVKVIYPKQELNMTEGDSMKLKCVTVYQPEMCKELSVYWCKENNMSECEAVSDPDRQLITMNETDDSELSTQRCRDVIFQLRNITAKDDGSFQCVATCSASGATAAIGHIITLTTHGTSEKHSCTVQFYLFSISACYLCHFPM